MKLSRLGLLFAGSYLVFLLIAYAVVINQCETFGKSQDWLCGAWIMNVGLPWIFIFDPGRLTRGFFEFKSGFALFLSIFFNVILLYTFGWSLEKFPKMPKTPKV